MRRAPPTPGGSRAAGVGCNVGPGWRVWPNAGSAVADPSFFRGIFFVNTARRHRQQDTGPRDPHRCRADGHGRPGGLRAGLRRRRADRVGQHPACGDGATAGRQQPTAVGHLANASGNNSTAVGDSAKATANNASAFGAKATAIGPASRPPAAIMATASNYASTAFGAYSSAAGMMGSAFGAYSNAAGMNVLRIRQRRQGARQFVGCSRRWRQRQQQQRHCSR